MTDKTPAAAGQSIEALRQRYEKLNETRIRIQARRESARERLDKLRESAVSQFGTDDMQELKRKLQAMQEENEEKRAAYEKSLNEIEEKLRQIEQESEQEPTG